MHKESKVADIDERIAKLESLVGSSSGSGLDDLVSFCLGIYIYIYMYIKYKRIRV